MFVRRNGGCALPNWSGCSLRVQLSIFMLLVIVAANVYMVLVWSPAQERESLAAFQVETMGHLVTVGDALQPYLIQGQLGAVNEMLDAIMARQHSWLALELRDADGMRLYPLFPKELDGNGQIFEFRHELHLRGLQQGTLKLWVDAAPITAEIAHHYRQMALFFTSAFVGAFILLLLFLETVVRRPVHQLGQAAERLAQGDFRAALPSVRADEIGRLVMSFSEMRDTIRDKELALDEARRQAEEASRAKSQFLANMSHELRTPMNAMLGYAQLLQADSGLSEQHQEDVAEILTAGRHLLDLINDVLDLAKVEAGKLQLEQIEVDLGGVVEEITYAIAPQAHSKGLELLIDLAPALPRRVVGDPARVRQVLVNLLGNAIKFTETGEVRVRVLPGAGEEVLFEVHDTGIGIDGETRKRLFRPFTQADETMSRRFGGTGLGLALTRELAEAMGGSAEVESELSRGSCFRVRLPLPALEAGAREFELAGQRFLVVDDYPANRELLGRYLDTLGAAHKAVDGGDAALAALREARYDWMLLDMQMPGMSGLELARDIQAQGLGHGARILLLTSAERPAPEDLAAVGIALAVGKPVGPSRLLDALKTMLPEARDRETAKAVSLPRYGGRILVVEDNLTNRQVALGMLGRFGLRPDVTEDGERALARLSTTRYDLVLMDVQMPRMDGYEATRRLRERERREGVGRTPVIALTANAMAGDREKALAAGMDDYLAKPVQLDQLADMVGRWLPRVDAGPARATAVHADGRGNTELDEAALANLRVGLAGVSGGLAQIVLDYLDDAPRLLEEIDVGLEAGDAGRVARAAHSLRSGSAALGATELAELCLELERCGREAALDAMAARLAAARRAFERARPALVRLSQTG